MNDPFGAAYVFNKTYDEIQFTETQKLLGPRTDERFGYACCISDTNGYASDIPSPPIHHEVTVLVIAAHDKSTPRRSPGSAYVYKWNDTSYTQPLYIQN